MTVTGNLTFSSGASYWSILNPTTASFATVAGTAALNGAVLGNLTPGAYSGSTKYTILDAGSITGSFTGFESVNAPGFTGTLTQVGDPQLQLQLVADIVGANQNQQNVANALNNFFNSGGALPASFVNVFGLTGASPATR